MFRAAKRGNSSNVHEWRTGCRIFTQWASVQPYKGMESWHMLPDWWASIASCWVKEARPKWAHTVWFCLYEMARKENSQTRKAGWQLPGTKSKGTREWLLSGYGVSFWDDENVLEFDGGDDCTRFYIFCCCCFVAKSCLTLEDLMDYNPADSSVHGISQARILEWVAISFSKGSSRPRDWNHILQGSFLANSSSWGVLWKSMTLCLAYFLLLPRREKWAMTSESTSTMSWFLWLPNGIREDMEAADLGLPWWSSS